MTVTLFHGYLGWAAGFLAILGAATIIEAWWSWLTERYTRGCPGLLTRRWDAPGARVTLPDGRGGWVLEVHYGGSAGDMATVRTYDGDERECAQWVPVRQLEPVRTFKAKAS